LMRVVHGRSIRCKYLNNRKLVAEVIITLATDQLLLEHWYLYSLFPGNSIASSYPASTCPITPIPGSFVNTRDKRSAASGVPSATIT
jgi:hypothetical protein